MAVRFASARQRRSGLASASRCRSPRRLCRSMSSPRYPKKVICGRPATGRMRRMAAITGCPAPGFARPPSACCGRHPFGALKAASMASTAAIGGRISAEKYGGINYKELSLSFWRRRLRGVAVGITAMKFAYNSAVTNISNTRITNVYNKTVINNNGPRTAFNGPGGAQARPTAEEEAAAKEQHVEATAEQRSHFDAAKTNPTTCAPRSITASRRSPRLPSPATSRGPAPSRPRRPAQAPSIPRPSSPKAVPRRKPRRKPLKAPNLRVPSPRARSLKRLRRPEKSTKPAPSPKPKSRP